MSEAERDFLDDDVTDEVEAETPEAETETEAEKVDETPAETPEPEVPTTPESKEERHVPYAAMKAEREKRQRLERELEELRQQQAQPQEPANFYENPDEFVQRHVQTVEQRAMQRLYTALEAQAREVHPDYDEVFEEVKEYAAVTPGVGQQILNSPNPAMAAYKLGKQLREMKQMQDPESYRQKIEAEVRAKVEAEFKAKEEQRAKAAASIPPDLTEARSAKGNDLPPPETVFDEIF